MLFAHKWPRLVMVVISTTFSTEQLKQQPSSNRFRSCLSEEEWATLVSIETKGSSDGPSSWRSGFKRNVALLAARHQSSQNLDTKAHGVALARLAAQWAAKTQLILTSLTSESAYVNAFRHLRMGEWPCLERIMCRGSYGNALPVLFLG